MLLRQDLRRGHQCRLEAVPCGTEGRRGCNHRLAAAHIALKQPVHGHAPAKIIQDLPDCPVLRIRQGKGEAPVKIHELRVPVDLRPLPGAGLTHQAEAC